MKPFAPALTLALATLALLGPLVPALAQDAAPADATETQASSASQSNPAEQAAATAILEAAAEGEVTPTKLDPGAAVGPKIGEYRFKLSFDPTEVEGMGLVRSKFENEGIFQDLLDQMSDVMALPQDIPVTFKDCDAPNAFWDPEARALTMCWDLIAGYNRGYERVTDEGREFLVGADQDSVLTGTTLFILMHELGHGLTDLFQLPTTGREEDAVDQFATLTMINGDEPGMPLAERPSRLALFGAYFFRELSTQPDELVREIFADEHALGQQRYYDVMCLVLGSDEEAYGPVLTPGIAMVVAAQEQNPERFDDDKLIDWLNKTDALNILPYERAARCESEYNKYNASWTFLTDSFMVPDGVEEGAAEGPQEGAAEGQDSP